MTAPIAERPPMRFFNRAELTYLAFEKRRKEREQVGRFGPHSERPGDAPDLFRRCPIVVALVDEPGTVTLRRSVGRQAMEPHWDGVSWVLCSTCTVDVRRDLEERGLIHYRTYTDRETPSYQETIDAIARWRGEA